MNYISPLPHGFSSHSETDELSVLVMETVADMERWSGVWMKLDQQTQSKHVYFQSYQWCRNWWVHHAKPKQDMLIFMLLHNGMPVAVLPMMRETSRLGLKVFRSLGEPHTQYSNILTARDQLSPAGSKLLLQALRAAGADILHFNYVPHGSPLLALLGETSLAPELENQSLQYDLTTFATAAAYDLHADKKLRQLRRRADTYLSKHGPLTLQVLKPSDSGYRDAIADCIAMKKVWINQTARNMEGLGQEQHAAFLASLPGDTLDDGAIVFALLSGSTAVAYQVGFLQHGHYYLYTAGFDWMLRAWSPGAVLIDMTLKWLIDKGIATFDMMGNPSGYKARLANKNVRLSGHVTTFSLRGTLHARLWVRLTRPVVRRFYLAAPTAVRRLLNCLRNFAPSA